MSQKTKDKTRGKGRTSVSGPPAAEGGGSPVASPDRGHGQPKTNVKSAEHSEKSNDTVNTSNAGSQTETEDMLTRILNRLDAIDAQNKVRLDKEEDHRKEQKEHRERLEKCMDATREAWEKCERKLVISEQQLSAARESNRRLEAQLNALDNQTRICNLRIEGKQEEDGENLMRFVLDLAGQVGANSITPSDIQLVTRLGKFNGTQQGQRNVRPRTVLVTLVNKQVRNKLYFARSKLHGVDRFRGIFVNDDVSFLTRRQRDEYRSVAAIAREDGAEIRVHDDGIIINGTKYLLGETHTLPTAYSIEKARTIEKGGEVYFCSQYSYLSNFAPSVIISDGTVYPTAEHYYQAEKCQHANDQGRRQRVLASLTPLEAKRVADELKSTPEWRAVRDDIMKKVINDKFSQNPRMERQLAATGDKVLNEATNNQHFGIGVAINSREINDKSYRGTNMLGQILMARRTEINT